MGGWVQKYRHLLLLLVVGMSCLTLTPVPSVVAASPKGPIVIIDIDGPITPATDDFLKTSYSRARERHARLFIIRLNTPGGLVPSMQSMVQALLGADIPTVVYVAPGGASATSAGVFITLAAHIAVMAPGTTIGAAHPVTGTGDDISGDMRAKVENFAVSLMRAIAEQRGRNITWAEQAVRESISITDRDAVAEKVIDFTASDLDSLLAQLEGRTVTVQGSPVTLKDLKDATQEPLEMNFKQRVVDVLSDPNVAILLGLGALVGIGIELYHPGLLVPGILGVVCLILSLVAAQVLPINEGGLVLFALGLLCFGVEMFMPTFGVWGIAGIVCVVLGGIYLIDSDLVWGFDVYDVKTWLLGGVAAVGALFVGFISTLAVLAQRRPVATGKEGLVGQVAFTKSEFRERTGGGLQGKVELQGELWNAQLAEGSRLPAIGQQVKVLRVESGLMLVVTASE